MKIFQQNNEKVYIYTTSLDSLITEEEKKYLNEYGFIGVDFNSNLGKTLSKHNKETILNNIMEKYNMRTIEVSLDEIDRLESARIMKNLGLILKVDNFIFVDDNQITFDSIIYVGPLAIEGYNNKMKKQNGRWIVYDKKLDWIS